jgi:hypothetical protein
MKSPRVLITSSLTFVLALSTALAQKAEKPWVEWSKKDVQKMLEDSPWAQVQNDTDNSQIMFSPTSAAGVNGAGSTSNDSSRLGQGATNQSVNVKFFVRLFSARPIRQALVRQMTLQQNLPDEALAKLRQFAEVKSENSIIFTLLYESNDQRAGNTVMQALNSNTTASLKNNTYLQRNDGKQLFLEEYVPPGKDGFGARFIFLKNADDKPFFDAGSGDIHFVAQFPNGFKIDRRFKIANMLYRGELEF